MSKSLSARPLRMQMRLNNLITILLGFAVLFAANYFGYRYYFRKDLSRGGYYQLSEKTLNVLKSLPEPVHITTCLLDSPFKSEIDNLLKEYQYRGGKNIKIERVDPALDFERAEILAKKFSFNTKENVIIFEYKEQSKFVSDTQIADVDPGPGFSEQGGKVKAFKGEQQFTATILSLVEGKTSKIYFLTGHGEREINNLTSSGGYGEIDLRIKRENNTTALLNLAESGSVPDDADILVIAGPKATLVPAEVDVISDYLDRKGKVILLQDPEVVSGLETLLQKYGITLQNDVAVSRARIPGLSTDLLIGNATASDYADHPAVRSLKGYNLQIPYARSVIKAKDDTNPNVAKVTELVKAPASFWGETNFKDKKPQFDPATDIPGPLTLAAVFDGGELPGEGVSVAGTRLVVVGSSAFLANQNLDGVGLDFFLGTLNWILKKEIAIGISPKVAQEFTLSISPLQKTTITVIAIALIPLLSLTAGTFIWFSRRR